MRAKLSLADRFFKVLVDEIRKDSPEYLTSAFTVAEIYQSLVPYRTHRDRIGAEMNGDYEDALLRLLAGEGGYLRLESETAQERIRLELRSSNPNTGLYREYAAVGVRLNPDLVGGAGGVSASDTEEGDDLDLHDLLGEVSGPSASDDDPEPGSADVSENPDASRENGSDTARASGSDAARASGSDAAPAKEAPEKKKSAASASDDSARGTDPVEPAPAGASKGETGDGGGGGSSRESAAALSDVDAEARPDGCPDCGTDLPDRETLRFCPFCGSNVFVAPCATCGEVLERRWSFCIACGTAAG